MTATSPASQRDRDILRSFVRRIDPSDAGAHNNLGVLYYHKGMFEEAVQAFSRALELDPKMQVAQRNLEVAYFNTGYYDRRITELRERLRANPADRDARWQLGLAEKASGDLARAQHWFECALALDANSPLLHFYIGEVLYNRGVNEEALAALRRSIELGPDNPDVHYLMGFVLGDMGRHEEARAATKRAIQLNPSLSRAQANLSLDRYNPAKYEELLPHRRERKSQQMMEVSGEGHL